MTAFLRLVTWASSGLALCEVMICSCKWHRWGNFTFAYHPPGAYLGCHFRKGRVWIARSVVLNLFFCSFLSVLLKSMMMTNIFPSAEVSHFLKWLKNKDWCGVCMCEISTAGWNSIVLLLHISLLSLMLIYLRTRSYSHIQEELLPYTINEGNQWVCANEGGETNMNCKQGL